MSSGERQEGEAAAGEGANSPLSFNALYLCLCGGRSPCQERGPAFSVPGCHICAAGALVGSWFVPPAATNVTWTLQLGARTAARGLGSLYPLPGWGDLRLGKLGHRLVWMGAFGLGWGPWQSPALVAEDKAGLAVGVS